MRLSNYILLAFIFAACAGCSTVRDFYGSAINLKGNGEQIPLGTSLKMSVTCSGIDSDGAHYVAFRLRRQNCWLVLFHPPIEPSRSLRLSTVSGDAAAWLVRGSKPDCGDLARHGRDAPFLSSRAERLTGSIELFGRAGEDFTIPVELIGETGKTTVHGAFRTYTVLWGPLVGPAMLFGVGGARSPKH